MPKSSSVVSDQLGVHARSIDRFLKKIDQLHNEGRILRKDAERAYHGAFLEFHTLVERSIESLFVGLLRKRLVSSDKAVSPLVEIKSDRVARAIVLGDRRYVDWLPYDRYTIVRAKAFFSSGKPFNRLEPSDKEALENASVIRNALAHQSANAGRRFKAKLIEGRGIPPAQHRPGPYLRGSHTVDQTRMNHMLGRLTLVLTKLCA